MYTGTSFKVCKFNSWIKGYVDLVLGARGAIKSCKVTSYLYLFYDNFINVFVSRFFGEEPPLLRMFLQELGYEVRIS